MLCILRPLAGALGTIDMKVQNRSFPMYCNFDRNQDDDFLDDYHDAGVDDHHDDIAKMIIMLVLMN